VSSIWVELAFVALAAMLSPTTLSWTVLVLVLAERPRRTGLWFYLGALSVTLLIGVVAGIVLGNAAASPQPSTPKTWVAIVDLVAGVLLLLYVVRAARRPPNPQRTAGMVEQMRKVASSPAVAIVGAGATLANPGAFIPLALKDISELNPSAAEYIGVWCLFALISLLPLLIALILLTVAPDWTGRTLAATRGWLEANAMKVAGVIVILLAGSLLKHGIAGVTS